MQDTDAKVILVVDDDIDIHALLKAQLEPHGFTVTSALNEKECFLELQKQPPDLILLDIQLQNTSGIKILRKLKTMESTSDLPVFMLTAKGDSKTVRDAISGLADNYVVKPFQAHDLLHRIGQIFTIWDVETVTKLVGTFGQAESGFLDSNKLADFTSGNWNAYRHVYGGVEVAVLIPNYLSPHAVSKFSKDQVRASVVVFVKRLYGWKRVWPKLATAPLKKSA